MGRLKELLKRILAAWSPGKHEQGDSEFRRFVRGRLRSLEHVLRYTIRDQELFINALAHRSCAQHYNAAGYSNERLEFLGDSVLNLVVGEYLYLLFPDAEEGELTKLRSRLVNRKSLAVYARAIHLSDFVLMSPSAAQAVEKGYETIISDTYEAIIAAMYLDGGFSAARQFVERQLHEAITGSSVHLEDDNYKSMLLELAQARGLGIPRYLIVKEEGPDHDRTFTVEVYLMNACHGVGTGKSKKDAEQVAASQALETL